MNRIHLALNTNKFEESVEFYKQLFATNPAKEKQNYAKFDLESPPLNLTLNRTEKSITAGDINHLGCELDHSREVFSIGARLKSLGFETTIQENINCCYAVQDKVWVKDPNGHDWEFFVVKQQT